MRYYLFWYNQWVGKERRSGIYKHSFIHFYVMVSCNWQFLYDFADMKYYFCVTHYLSDIRKKFMDCWELTIGKYAIEFMLWVRLWRSCCTLFIQLRFVLISVLDLRFHLLSFLRKNNIRGEFIFKLNKESPVLLSLLNTTTCYCRGGVLCMHIFFIIDFF